MPSVGPKSAFFMHCRMAFYEFYNTERSNKWRLYDRNGGKYLGAFFEGIRQT
jgi:hypothetical protein